MVTFLPAVLFVMLYHQNWIDNTVKNAAVWFGVVVGWRFAYCLLHVHNNVSDNMDKDSSSTEPNIPTMC